MEQVMGKELSEGGEILYCPFFTAELLGLGAGPGP